MPHTAASPCTTPGCGAKATNRGRCTRHQRGTTTQRGYNTTHQQLRAQWAPHVATGHINCARCHQPITPGQPWDLGHTNDRTTYTGPEHAGPCNRAAARRSALK